MLVTPSIEPKLSHSAAIGCLIPSTLHENSASAPGLLPADHVRLLHPVERRGKATIAVRGDRWVERAVPIADLADYAAAYQGVSDTYVSQQSFYGRRRIAQLAQLGALYSDLDYRNTEQWSGESPERVCRAFLAHLQDLRLPVPTYVLATGRGLQTTWLHDAVPRAALPRWMAAQKYLQRQLRPFGADPRAIDAARVFRLCGTRHSLAGAIVRPIWTVASPASMWRWDFEDLLREILPLARAELEFHRIRRAMAAQGRSGRAPVSTLTAATYWETVLSDLQKLRRLRWFDSIASKSRPLTRRAPASRHLRRSEQAA
jgi:hypothetical protein